MIIRSMEPKELDSVLILFEYYRMAAGIDEERYDQDKVLKTIKEYCIRPNLFFRVAYNGQRPVGVIGGFLSDDPVEFQTAATIQFNFLIDEFASVENYQSLIDEFQQWAKSYNVEQIRAIDIGYKINRLDDVYYQLGFDPVRINVMNKEIA